MAGRALATAKKYLNDNLEFAGLFNTDYTIGLEWRKSVPMLYELCSEKDAKRSRIAELSDEQKKGVSDAHQLLKK